jgi:hypothetical protein
MRSLTYRTNARTRNEGAEAPSLFLCCQEGVLAVGLVRLRSGGCLKSS